MIYFNVQSGKSKLLNAVKTKIFNVNHHEPSAGFMLFSLCWVKPIVAMFRLDQVLSKGQSALLIHLDRHANYRRRRLIPNQVSVVPNTYITSDC